MTTEEARFAQVHDLFLRVVDASNDERERILTEECANDPALAAEVRSLIQADAELVTGRMTRAIDAAKRRPSRGPHDDLVGATLGAYRLKSILGRGGAGTVYLGERVDRKYSAHVAIKVLAEKTDSPLHARFGGESQILAGLNHPNIARLLDAGESESHYPYIVMEYVHGESLNEYCDKHKLSIERRLELFLQVCGAVQYAHRNLIVHRDIKPSNILVTDDGAVKLLDFGIAKLLSSAPSAAIALTRLHDRALTPEYASPEQIAGRAVTTLSDVYSLGVLLYELLTGLHPYDLHGKSQIEVERAICNVDPPKPSVAVKDAIAQTETARGQMVIRAAASCNLSPQRLVSQLAGDLDAIVMLALRKEPDKRYGSVEMLAQDISRYLQFEPVSARQGQWTYYFTRFLRRHWIPVTASAAVTVALVASVVITTAMYRQAKIDRDHAQAVSELMSSIFSDANPYITQGETVTALHLLDAADQRLSGGRYDPAVEGSMRAQLGDAYLNLGQYGKAIVHLRRSLELRRTLSSTPKEQLVKTLLMLANSERGSGNFAEAESYYMEARSILQAAGMRDSVEYVELLRFLGRLENSRGDLDAAERSYTASAEIARKLTDRREELAQTLVQLAQLHNWKGDLPKAERIGREALAIFEATTTKRHPDYVTLQFVLGDVLAQRGLLDEAAGLLEASVEAHRALYQNGGPRLAASLNVLAWLKYEQGRSDEALLLLSEAFESTLRGLGESHYEVGVHQTSLGRLLVYRKDFAAAKSNLEAALKILERTLPADHQYIASAQYWLGEALLGLRDLNGAQAVLTKSSEVWKQGKAAPWLVARTESALGQVFAEQGDRDKAATYLNNAYSVLLKERGAQDESTKLALTRLQAFNGKNGSNR